MCPYNEEEQSVEHPVYVCRMLEPQRSSVIQHIMNREGILPPPQKTKKQVAKYLNAFLHFVKSIDFSKVQQTEKEITCIYCINIICGQ